MRRLAGKGSDNPRTRPVGICNMVPVQIVRIGKAMSQLDEFTKKMRAAVGEDSGLGKTLKYDLKGDGFIFIDGGTLTNEDKPADLTLTISLADLRELYDGRLSPMSAVMGGKLKMSDMGLAMQLQSKLEALGRKMMA
jgi:putative sterol carrier protein